MNTLMLIPGVLSSRAGEGEKAGAYPESDPEALAAALRSQPDGRVEVLDHAAVDRSRNVLVAVVRRLAGHNWALALLAAFRCRRYDAVFSQALVIGKRFALFSAVLPRRPRHVAQAFCVTSGHRWIWFRLLAVQRRIDSMIFFSRDQYDAARTKLGVPEHKVVLLENGFVDTAFFRPRSEDCARANQLCAAGLAYRDYPTLLSAVARLPHLTLKIEAGSSSMKIPHSFGLGEAPPNVEICHLEMGAVWRLYAESAVVAVPLHPNPVGAGLTTVLEAMAMGKPVIITRCAGDTFGGRKQFVDGENVLLVDVADIEGWRRALTRLSEDAVLRARLGRNARLWIEQHASRRQVQQIIIATLQGRQYVEAAGGQNRTGVSSSWVS